jgi:hypothetical protein
MLTYLDSHVFGSPTMCGGRPGQWAQCLKQFTDRNARRHVVIEEDLRDLGIVPTAVDVELLGICYDRRDGNVQIMLGGGTADAPHRTLVVRGVAAVDTLSSADGKDYALRLAIPRGQVLLTFLKGATSSRQLP